MTFTDKNKQTSASFPINGKSFDSGVGNLLSGVVAGALGELITQDQFRRYKSDLTTQTILRGVVDSSTKAILFEVGARNYSASSIARHLDITVGGDCAIRVDSLLAADFAGAARKYANFTGDFAVMDLGGVVERLAAGIAFYANTGSLTALQLRGGGNVNVVAVGSATQPVAASRDKVFMPRCVDHVTSPNTYAAIVNAVSGEGGTLVTDVLEIDPATNQIILPSVSGVDLAEGCYHALRIIGSNYEQSGAGDIFAYALTRGIHSQVTVVGHTDEGGYMRSVLRRGRFAVPFGGIDTRLRGYVGLPRPVSASLGGYQQFVDSIALATAAAVATADPLVSNNGKLYPTVFSVQDGLDRAGVHTDAKDNDSVTLANKIMGASSAFAANYVRMLCKIFAINGDTGLVVRHMTMCFGLIPSTGDRHLKHKVVAPFYWIEPTGVLHTDDASFDAIKAGFGPLTKPGHTAAVPMFEDVSTKELGGGLVGVNCSWRSARTSGLLTHLQGHRLDGLANFVMRRGDIERFALVGGTSKAISERMIENADLASYLWGRGQSCIPAPGEMIYTGNALAFIVKLGHFDEQLFSYQDTHVPTASEMMTGTVSVSCTRAAPMACANISTFTRRINRSRSAAAAALSNARLSNVNMMLSDEFSMSFSDVAINTNAAPPTSEFHIKRDESASATTVVDHGAPTHVDVSMETVRGVKAPTVVHETPQSGPKIGRQVISSTETNSIVDSGAGTTSAAAPEIQ